MHRVAREGAGGSSPADGGPDGRAASVPWGPRTASPTMASKRTECVNPGGTRWYPSRVHWAQCHGPRSIARIWQETGDELERSLSVKRSRAPDCGVSPGGAGYRVGVIPARPNTTPGVRRTARGPRGPHGRGSGRAYYPWSEPGAASSPRAAGRSANRRMAVRVIQTWRSSVRFPFARRCRPSGWYLARR